MTVGDFVDKSERGTEFVITFSDNNKTIVYGCNYEIENHICMLYKVESFYVGDSGNIYIRCYK